MLQCRNIGRDLVFHKMYNIIRDHPRGQSLFMRSRVRFPVLPWEFSLKGRIPAVTMVRVV